MTDPIAEGSRRLDEITAATAWIRKFRDVPDVIESVWPNADIELWANVAVGNASNDELKQWQRETNTALTAPGVTQEQTYMLIPILQIFEKANYIYDGMQIEGAIKWIDFLRNNKDAVQVISRDANSDIWTDVVAQNSSLIEIRQFGARFVEAIKVNHADPQATANLNRSLEVLLEAGLKVLQ